MLKSICFCGGTAHRRAMPTVLLCLFLLTLCLFLLTRCFGLAAPSQAAGTALFQDAKWVAEYVAAVSAALGRPMIRVDVPSMAITY